MGELKIEEGQLVDEHGLPKLATYLNNPTDSHTNVMSQLRSLLKTSRRAVIKNLFALVCKVAAH